MCPHCSQSKRPSAASEGDHDVIDARHRHRDGRRIGLFRDEIVVFARVARNERRCADVSADVVTRDGDVRSHSFVPAKKNSSNDVETFAPRDSFEANAKTRDVRSNRTLVWSDDVLSTRSKARKLASVVRFDRE